MAQENNPVTLPSEVSPPLTPPPLYSYVLLYSQAGQRSSTEPYTSEPPSYFDAVINVQPNTIEIGDTGQLLPSPLPSAPMVDSIDNRPCTAISPEFIGDRSPSSDPDDSGILWRCGNEDHDYETNLPSLHSFLNTNRTGGAVVGIDKFSGVSTRMIYIRKVFCILMIQFVMSSVIISIFLSHFEDFDLDKDKVGVDNMTKCLRFLLYAFLAVFVLSIMAYFWEWPRKKCPQNIILLEILTLTYSVLGGIFSACLRTSSLLYTIRTTALISLALMIFSLQKRCELTSWSGFFVVGIVLASIPSIRIFQPTILPSVTKLFWSFPLTIMVSAILIYDVKRIIGQKHKFVISPEDGVLGALAVYLDFIMIPIFACLVCLCGDRANCSGRDCGFENAIDFSKTADRHSYCPSPT